MTPRRPTSKKWTSLPAELLEQIRQVFSEGFAQQTAKGEILVEGRIYAEELLLRVGYLEKGRLAQANFEVSLDFNAAKQNALEQVHFAIDCAASMMEDYFQNDQSLIDFPRIWQPFQISGREVFLQASNVNTRLEAEADRILGTHDDHLVKDADEDEVRTHVHHMLGLEGEDFDDEDAEGTQTDSKSEDEELSPSGSETKH